MLLIYSPNITERLRYIANTLLAEIAGTDIGFTSDKEKLSAHNGPRLNYSAEPIAGSFQVLPHSLLFEEGIREQDTHCFETLFSFEGQPVKAFFGTGSPDFPFDIFAASFYLLSRYEEYLPHRKDSYGRYAHTESLAFREGFLHLPMINIWLEELKSALQQKFETIYFRPRFFKFIPTYDIDIAYAYRHKGWVRTAGGLLKAIFQFRFGNFADRIRVIAGKKEDPYDAYEWLDSLHLYCRLKPIYFFLVALQQKGYDKNTPVSSKAYRELIAYYARSYKTGLHPSWKSGDDFRTLKEEKELLDVLADMHITRSRQHYLRFDLPESYRRLQQAGIEQEYSMGYGSINGFRASVASSFYWFDLEKNKTTSLVLYPFCFMDANAHFEQGYSPHQGYAELKKFYAAVQKVNGLFITIWHNNFLGNNPGLKGWREVYEIFLKEDVYWD